MSELVSFLTKFMDEKNLTQSEFSRLSGIPRQVINNYMEGKVKSPSDDYVRKIAKATGQTEEFIFNLVGKLREKLVLNPAMDKLFNEIASLDEETMREVSDFIAFKHSQKNKNK